MVENRTLISAEAQINFLQKIQTLFENSSFNATYKYALLTALTDLAIELGNDFGGELKLTSEQIAQRIAELYWPQTQTYSGGFRDCGILNQNKGNQAEIITILVDIQSSSGETKFSEVIKLEVWHKRIKKIIRTIWENPVFHLQENSNQFIFMLPSQRNFLVLTKEAHFCFRKFNEYISQYAKNGWMAHLKSNHKNKTILNHDSDLESFLFGNPRNDLGKLRPYLIDFQEGRCFYCQKLIKDDLDIDHFIPWKKYSRNLAENFVLSCSRCNRSKSDMLAGIHHLDNWLSNSVINKEKSIEICNLGFVSDPLCSLKISHWAYANGQISNSKAWVRPQNFEMITDIHTINIAKVLAFDA